MSLDHARLGKDRATSMSARRRFIGVDDMRDKFAGCGRSSIYRWEAEGVIPHGYKIGNRRMWDEAEVDAHIASQREHEAA